MDISDTVKNLYYNTFNAQLASYSAVANGFAAAVVNYGSGNLEMLAAGGTQGIASFISTGFTARLVQHYSPLENKFDSYFYGSLVPAVATFVISYAGHSGKNLLLNWASQHVDSSFLLNFANYDMHNPPNILISCIVPTFLSLFSSPITNFLTKKGYFRPKNYPASNNTS